MKPFEERYTAWVDGKLSGPELARFERELADRSEGVAGKAETQRLGELLRAHSAVPPLSNGDFFNQQIMHSIEWEERRVPHRRRASWWSIPRLVWAGAAFLLLAGGLFKIAIPPETHIAHRDPYFVEIVDARPVDPSISVTTVYNPDDNVTILWLEGLDYLPASYALK